jgi:hypothetical protein
MQARKHEFSVNGAHRGISEQYVRRSRPSPEMYRNQVFEHDRRALAEVGGGSYHSCGRMKSTDDGESFSEHGQAREQITPCCHAGLVRYPTTDDDAWDILLFSNPAWYYYRQPARWNLFFRSYLKQGFDVHPVVT